MASSYAGEGPGIKAESNTLSVNETELHIKSDPDSKGVSPAALSDEDIYEEDPGDLDFSGAAEGVYLTRIPKFLWENWAKLAEDQEIQLGTVRIEGTPGDVKRMSLMLAPDVAKIHSVPKEYNMQVTNRAPANTFIFTEKDLPGYAANGRHGVKQGHNNGGQPYSYGPPRPMFQDRSRQSLQKYDKNKKWQPYYRKAIPKHTAMAGRVQAEINCLPVENEEYSIIMNERTKQAMKPKRETKLLTGHVFAHGGNLLAPGTLGPSGSFGTFIKTTGPQRGKPQEYKAARIPQNELLDLIYDCFKRYNYWPLRSLKVELNQPEAYLKQTLEKIAHLVRQGPHAMTWQLKPEARISAYANAESYEHVKDEIAPDTGYSLDGQSDVGDTGEGLGTDEDDENVKMEDVLL